MTTEELDIYAAWIKYGELGLPYDLDSWNGYPVAREKFYELAKRAGAKDLVVLAGDSHSFWSNALYDAYGMSMGVELGTGAITSPGFPFAGNRPAQQLFNSLTAEQNAEVLWTDDKPKGFVRLDFRVNKARVDYVAVSDIDSRNYKTATVRSVTISHDGDSLSYS